MKTKSEINTIAGAGSLILWALIIYFIMESAAGCGPAIKPNCVSFAAMSGLAADRVGKVPARIAVSHTDNPRIGHVWAEVFVDGQWVPVSYDGFDIVPMPTVTNGHRAYKYLTLSEFFREMGY